MPDALPKNIHDTHNRRPILENFHSSLGTSKPSAMSQSPENNLAQIILTDLTLWPSESAGVRPQILCTAECLFSDQDFSQMEYQV